MAGIGRGACVDDSGEEDELVETLEGSEEGRGVEWVESEGAVMSGAIWGV
jgi:hypothetical protein